MTMSDEPSIRTIRPSDRKRLRSLALRLGEQKLPAWRDPEPIRRQARAGQAVFGAPLPRDQVILVAEGTDGAILGYAQIGLDRDHFSGEPMGHVFSLVTDPAAEGQGVASRLLDTAGAWALDHGATGLLLFVFATNDRARALYRRCGFQEDMISMVKPLRRPAGPA